MSDFDFTDELNVGKEYNGFILLKIDDIPEEKAKGVFLRHKTTGLEVYHIIKEDRENLFAYTFRTPVSNSKGIPHIIEHSVLCGSERFPLKEPFTALENQSVKSYLNAYTAMDRTSYPAASIVPADFYNLFDVYSDAVFFPKLTRETFEQEGWRIELGNDDSVSVQGIVYNEMKGIYSNFGNCLFQPVYEQLFKDSIYSYESGGDPVEITSLTYEEFIDFYNQYYKPSNCLLFLYGDIPTSRHLDFLNEKYISRLESKYSSFVPKASVQNSPFSVIDEDIKSKYKVQHISESVTVNTVGPDNGESGSSVGIVWYCNLPSIERIFLNDLLFGTDSSSLTVKLKESNLGEDIGSLSGGSFVNLYEGYFGIGLDGVREKDVSRVYDFIEKSIKELCEEGIPQNEIDAAIMGIDFYLHEVSRYYGPHSLNLLSKVAGAWVMGEDVSENISNIRNFEKVKEKIASDPDYIVNIIKSIFIYNKTNLRLCVTPSKQFFDERNKKEQLFLQNIEKKLDKVQLKNHLEELHAYQQREETEEELQCIPHLKISELPPDLNYPEVSVSTIPVHKKDSSDTFELPVIYSQEETNGVVYFEVMCPMDNLKPEDIRYISLLNETIGELGWNGKNWKDCTAHLCTILGDFVPMTTIGCTGGNEHCENNIKNMVNPDMGDRLWLRMTSKFLSSQIEPALELISEMISTMDFKDKKHFQTLFKEFKHTINTMVSGNEGSLLGFRSAYTKNIPCMFQELYIGLSHYFYIKSLKLSQSEKLLKKLGEMYRSILSQGAIIHITADEDSIKVLNPMLPEFAEKTGLLPLQKRIKYKIEDYLPFVYHNKDYDPEKKLEILEFKTQSGCALSVFNSSGLFEDNMNSEIILQNWMSGHQLWEKIRMTGGAYGGRACVIPVRKVAHMSSYRDPTPEKSLELFGESLKEMTEILISEENLERTLISFYSDSIPLESPKARGDNAMNAYLYGKTNDYLRKSIEKTMKLTPVDIQNAAKRLYDSWQTTREDFICCENSNKSIGNIIKILL